MNSTQESPAIGDSRIPKPTPSWEYQFFIQDEWSSIGVRELAAEGWAVVSYGIRRDNRREYLLRKARQ